MHSTLPPKTEYCLLVNVPEDILPAEKNISVQAGADGGDGGQREAGGAQHDSKTLKGRTFLTRQVRQHTRPRVEKVRKRETGIAKRL